MQPAFVSLIASTSVLIALVLLFGVEMRRGARFFRRLREAFDRAIVGAQRKGVRSLRFIERDVIRQTVHYLFHQMLRFGLRLTRFVERRLDWLLHRNRAIARKTSGARVPTTTQTKLSEIAKHKADNALSEPERRAHKEHSIGTRL